MQTSTWSIAEGRFPWWKVDTSMASALTWFILTLNWSCSIRALSSHIVARFSFLLEIILAFMLKNNHTDTVIPIETPRKRSFFLHLPKPFEFCGWESCCCCFCCFCCWTCLFDDFHNIPLRAEPLQKPTAPNKANHNTFPKSLWIFSRCSSLLFNNHLGCKAFGDSYINDR